MMEQTDSHTLTIAPLSTPGCLSAASHAALHSGQRLFAQTLEHPCAAALESLRCTTMDDLYESCADFDALSAAIAERLLCGEDAVYAVPGRGVSEELLAALQKAAPEQNTRLLLLPGSGYAEAAACAAGFSPARMTFCPANALPDAPDYRRLLCVEELDTRIRAGEVKLSLSEYYPDEFDIFLCTMAQDGAYTARRMPLCELDRQAADCYFAATCALLPAADPMQLSRHGMDGLMRVLARLRAPGGCPWDAEQTHLSLRGALIEEAYEVLDALEREDSAALCEELGDLLLQVAFHAMIAQEQADFTFRDITTCIVQKLVYRHPHVFASTRVSGSDEVLVNWEKLKKAEKHFDTYTDMMQAIPRCFPALMRSAKVQKKAANAGFDWSSASEALYKLPEETQELQEAMAEGDDAHIDEELGDLLFSAVNVARLLHRDPEAMLRSATDKFIRRFEITERLARESGQKMEDLALQDLDALWERAKCEK